MTNLSNPQNSSTCEQISTGTKEYLRSAGRLLLGLNLPAAETAMKLVFNPNKQFDGSSP
tara:strand:- start:43 stop:219 length:177 start_codon:yes stop_codon:yes gene_type:complete